MYSKRLVNSHQQCYLAWSSDLVFGFGFGLVLGPFGFSLGFGSGFGFGFDLASDLAAWRFMSSRLRRPRPS